MKKILLLILLIGVSFADYRITQYQEFYGYSSSKIKIWTCDFFRPWIKATSTAPVAIEFTDKKTNKKVIVSIPYTIEEL